MDNAGTVCQRNEVSADDIIRFLFRFSPVIKRHIFAHFKVFADNFVENLIFLFEYGRSKGFSEIVDLVAVLDLDIGFHGVYGEGDVGRKRPRCCRPRKNEGVLIDQFELDDGRSFLDVFITLRNLMRGKRSTATRAIRNDLIALIEQTAIPNLFQRPPFGLDIFVVISDIRILHIRPKTDGCREVFPHILVLPDTFLTVVNKAFQTVGFNLVLAVDSERLFDFKFDRQTMGIPSRLTGDMIALHRLITRDHILDNTGENMTDVRFSVCRRRTVIEGEFFITLTLSHTLFKYPIFTPEAFGLFFAFYKRKTGVDLVVHL